MSSIVHNTLRLLAAALLFCGVVSAADKNMSLDEVVAKHLESIGNAQARAGVKSRVAEGTLQFNEINSGRLLDRGQAKIMCLGTKLRVGLPLSAPNYPGEHFAFDGQRSSVAPTAPGSFSALGDFMREESPIVEDGLLGGALSTAWTLLNVKGHTGKLIYDGVKRIDNRELHQLIYVPKKRGETAEMRIYLEAETFRHVMTLYSRMRGTKRTDMSSGATVGAGADEWKQIVEERFSDFRTSDGLTLPTRWEIRTRREPSSSPQELQLDVKITGILHNTLTQ